MSRIRQPLDNGPFRLSHLPWLGSSRAVLVSAMIMASLGHLNSVQAADSVSASVISYQTFHFNSDLSAVNSEQWLVNQLTYAQLLHRPDITQATLERLFAISPNNLAGLKFQAMYFVDIKQLDLAQAILKPCNLKRRKRKRRCNWPLFIYLFHTSSRLSASTAVSSGWSSGGVFAAL